MCTYASNMSVCLQIHHPVLSIRLYCLLECAIISLILSGESGPINLWPLSVSRGFAFLDELWFESLERTSVTPASPDSYPNPLGLLLVKHYSSWNSRRKLLISLMTLHRTRPVVLRSILIDSASWSMSDSLLCTAYTIVTVIYSWLAMRVYSKGS